MRKYQVISLIIVLIVIVAGWAIVADRRQDRAQEAAMARQIEAEKLADWQARVKEWRKQQQVKTQVATTTEQSDLQSQGVTDLPNTGPGSLAIVAIVVLICAGAHNWRLRTKLQS